MSSIQLNSLPKNRPLYDPKGIEPEGLSYRNPGATDIGGSVLGYYAAGIAFAALIAVVGNFIG